MNVLVDWFNSHGPLSWYATLALVMAVGTALAWRGGANRHALPVDTKAQTPIYDNASLWQLYLMILGRIDAGDRKLEVTLGLATGILALLAPSVFHGKVQQCLNAGNSSTFAMAASVYAASTGLTILICWIGLIASVDTIRSERDKSIGRPLTYFGHIARVASPDKYLTLLTDQTSHARFADLAFQIWEVAALAKRKYAVYRIAWLTLAFAAASLVFVVFLGGQGGCLDAGSSR